MNYIWSRQYNGSTKKTVNHMHQKTCFNTHSNIWIIQPLTGEYQTLVCYTIKVRDQKGPIIVHSS